MSILSRVRAAGNALIRGEEKTAGTHNAANVYNNGMPLWGGTGFLAMCAKAFQMNEAAYSGIMRVVSALNEAPLKVWSPDGPVDGRELKRHPLSAVLRKPNPHHTMTQLIAIMVIHRILSGNAFWEIARTASGRPAEFWPLRPDYMKVVPHPEKFIAGYIYTVGGKEYPLAVEDVIHFKDPSPTDPYFGQSRLLAASRTLDTDNEATGTAKTILQNGGVPAFAAFLNDEIVDDDHLERMRAQFSRRFGGDPSRRDTVGFFDNIRDIKPIGMNFDQMAFPDLRNISEARILQCIGCPPIVAGALVGLESATYSNAEQFRVLFWENCVAPLGNDTEQSIDQKLEAELGGNVVGFDPSKVSALRSLRESEREKARNEFDSGLITRGEFRRRMNLVERPSDNVYKMKFTDSFVNADAKPVDPAAPPVPGPAPTPPADPTAPAPGDPPAPVPPTKAKPRLVREGKSVTVHREGHRASTGGHTKAASQCPCVHTKAKVDGLGQLRGPLGRVGAAQRFAQEFKDWARTENAWQINAVKAAMRRADYSKAAKDALTPAQMDEVMVEFGGFTQHAADTVKPIISKVMSESAMLAGVEMGLDIDFFIDNEAAANFIKGYTYKFADKYAETSRGQIRDVILRSREDGLNVAQINGALDAKLEDWEAYRVDRIARSETIRSSNAGAVSAYKEGGVDRVRWVASDAACEYCAPLDGTEMDIGGAWFNVGDTYTPPRPDDWGDDQPDPSPMSIDYEAIEYAPLHPNCECTVEAVV